MEKDILAEAKDVFEACEENESDNRAAGLDDLKFGRLGDQWPEWAKAARGKDRPMLTLNRIPAFVRQVTNDARQNKPSIKVHPADSAADVETAKVLDGLIRNIEYISNADVAYDTAIDFAASCGFGYIGVDVGFACDDSFDKDIKIRRINDPFTVYGDPNNMDADSAEWDNAFETWLFEKDEFKELYPDADQSDWSKSGSDKKDTQWNDGKYIRVARWWRRSKVTKQLLLLSDGKAILAEDFVRQDPETGVSMQMIAANEGLQVIRERDIQSHEVKMHLINGRQELDKPLDWVGKYIPLIPVYGEEIIVEGKRHLKSLFRDAKDAQRMFNFWRTTCTELVALSPKAPWVGPKGFAKSDPRWKTANTANHAYLEYDGTQPPIRDAFAGIPAGALQEALSAQDDMKAIMGLFDPSLGKQKGDQSGRAILALQQEGDVSTFHFQDNMVRAIRHTGRIILDLMPKVYSAERIVRVLGEDGTPTTVQINKEYEKQGPDGSKIMAIHDLTAGKYDLTVKAGPSFTTRRQESAEQMMQMVQSFPDSAPVIGDLIAKNLDWPGADEVAERLRAINPALQPPKDPAQDPELMKKQKELEMEERKASNDIMLSQRKMEMQEKQAVLNAEIKLAEHQADMEMMREKHAMTMNQSREKSMQDMHGKTVEALNAPEDEGMPKHPLVQLLESFVVGNQQMTDVQQQNAMAMTELAKAVAMQATAPKTITMNTSQGKTLTAQVN